MRTGSAGFVTSPDAQSLNIQSTSLTGEPADLSLTVGSKVSVVGIEFETRRRNRLNATIVAAQDNVLSMRVDQSYGNCPKYIQVRNKTAIDENQPSNPSQTTKPTDADKIQIAAADTLLIASRAALLGDDPRAGIDINHRGGMPGFVTVLDDHTIEFPDYKGNSFYNTFGNIVTDSRVGLQFVDFESGTLLNIKGNATLVEKLNSGELPLMERGLRITIDTVVRAEGALPIRYAFGDYSECNPTITA